MNFLNKNVLIHEADPQIWSVVITIFICSVSQSVRSHISKSQKTNQIKNENSMGLAKWLIDGTCVLFHFYFDICGNVKKNFQNSMSLNSQDL